MLIKVGTFAVTALMALSGLATLTVGSGLALFTGQSSNTNNTFTSADCFPGNTGLLNPSANGADTGGSGNGFETNPTFAYADAGGVAGNINGASDRHRYYNYSLPIGGGCAIKGIEVRLDWYLDDDRETNSMSVELSWDGGTSWTAPKTDTVESVMTEHTTVLGSSTDTWGRSWTVNELSNASFRVRLTSNCSGIPGQCSKRDYYLDWVPVTIYYGPP